MHKCKHGHNHPSEYLMGLCNKSFYEVGPGEDEDDADDGDDDALLLAEAALLGSLAPATEAQDPAPADNTFSGFAGGESGGGGGGGDYGSDSTGGGDAGGGGDGGGG